MARILENRSQVVWPVVDNIMAEDLRYDADLSGRNVGIFTWDLTFNWKLLPQAVKSKVAPVR